MTQKTKKNEKPVNVHSDKEMREAGFFRPFNVVTPDFSKTKKEKKALKKAKERTQKIDNGHIYMSIKPYSPVRAKVIVYLRKNKTFPYTVYSALRYQDQIDDFLNKFCNSKTGKSLVVKYSFNGKTYSPNERPFNAW